METQLATLNRLCKEQDDVYRAYSTRLGLGDTAFWVLYALTEKENAMTQKELCELWFYPKQTMNCAVISLENQGLITLRLKEGSKKEKEVALTEQGKAYTEQHILPLQRAEQTAFLSLEDQERDHFLALFKAQIDTLRSLVNTKA